MLTTERFKIRDVSVKGVLNRHPLFVCHPEETKSHLLSSCGIQSGSKTCFSPWGFSSDFLEKNLEKLFEKIITIFLAYYQENTYLCIIKTIDGKNIIKQTAMKTITVEGINFVSIREKAAEFAEKVSNKKPVNGTNITLLRRHTFTEISAYYNGVEICRVKLVCELGETPYVCIYGDLIPRTKIIECGGVLDTSAEHIAKTIANTYIGYAAGMLK